MIVKMIEDLLQRKRSDGKCKIRTLARLNGTLVSICPAVKYGWIYCKRLQREQYLALQAEDGDYNALMDIKDIVEEDLHWWSDHILAYSMSISCFKPRLGIFSDASLTGWGAACRVERSGGLWGEAKARYPMNYLELHAVFLALKCYAREEESCDILLRIDNTTAISYVNRMGGVRKDRNLTRKQAWNQEGWIMNWNGHWRRLHLVSLWIDLVGLRLIYLPL